MSSKTQDTSKLEKKRAQFTEAAPTKGKTKLILTASLLALAGVVAYFALGSANEWTAPVATPTQSQPAGGTAASDIRISISDLSDGKAKFFDYKAANGTAIRYFVVKSSDGVYHAALDACDVCFHAKQGYHQEGADMVCNNCGKHFPVIQVNEVNGGCNPIGLTRAVEGDHLIVKASELEQGSRYF
jgi:uncharacterized membrane protein